MLRFATLPLAVAALLGAVVTGYAQTPAGAIAGVVTDPSDAVIPGAGITITSAHTGLTRTVVTADDGAYYAPGLPAGAYQVRAEAPRMRPIARPAIVETGTTTTVDLPMQLGVVTEVLNVDAASPQIRHDGHFLAGVVSRIQIENLPLNGRNFLELAGLEPGVTTMASSSGGANHQFQVFVLGALPTRTRVTVDGGNVSNYITGGNSLNLSQDLVEEFQISTVNFGPATGVTATGAVNIATRSGGNGFHGSGFYFFRDHHIAAYPALRREPLNPDPFFARRQAGLCFGGPIRKDRLFFFGNIEHNNQDAVVTVQPRAPEFTSFGQIAPSPLTGMQLSSRFDARLNEANNLFVRYSHEDNRSFSPPFGAISLPSNWLSETNWSDQSIASLTSVLRPNLINELRFSYSYWRIRDRLPTAGECAGDCIGLGFPRVEVLGTGLLLGNYDSGGADLRRFATADSGTWLRGPHRLLFGFEWERYLSSGSFAFHDPASMVLYSPETVRLWNSAVPPEAAIPLPASFRTIADILRLPLVAFVTGIGDPRQPPAFQADRARVNNRWLFYWHDTWRLRPRLTLNFGLRYSYDSNALNHDLDKPAYLAPILGRDSLKATRRDTNNLGPMIGLAWSASNDDRTVVRAGAGIYYDTMLQIARLTERAVIGPLGNGRFPIEGAFVPNPIPNIPGVPLFQRLDFTSGPTRFTGAHLASILPAVRASLEQQLGGPQPNSPSLTNIDVFKQGIGLFPHRFPMAYGQHFNLGMQRKLARDLVVTADLVFRQFIHTLMSNVDYNRWNSVRGSVIPSCSPLEVMNPAVPCSTGPIAVNTPAGRSHYRGLLIKADKRFSRRTQFLASYAVSSNVGDNGVINNDDWFASFGPLVNDRRHVLSFSSIVDLPKNFRLAVISSVSSRPPFNTYVAGLDFNGDGTNDDTLPGSGFNRFNRGLAKTDLDQLVGDFNRDRAGRTTPRGQRIPHIVLPASYEFGDGFSSLDVRLCRLFRLGERYKLALLGEVFNVLNVANLQGHSGNLAEPAALGQPALRVTQVFGSGGPRAFQFGGRLSF